MSELGDDFWSGRYISNQTGWDVGQVSRPIKEYIDQLKDKNLSILIPGCGNAYEAAYLLSKGFTNITLVDISKVLVDKLKILFSKEIKEGRCHLIHCDFFDFEGQFDLVIEQTFFCALMPTLRESYVKKMNELVKVKGKLAGLLFDMEKQDGPPFGGNYEEYQKLFSSFFTIKILEPSYNSIASRSGREFFIILKKQ